MNENRTQAIERALDIIFSLAEAEHVLTVPEIAQKVEIPESTAYRLLKTLEQYGVVERRAAGQIRLGGKILDLARSLYQQMDRELLIIARPYMEQLTEKYKETSILCVRTASQVVCVQSVETDRMIRLSIPMGKTLPLHRGASGKAILAFEQKRTLELVMQRLEQAGGTALKELELELRAIRKEGHCLTVGEVDTDIFGLAAPIYDAEGRVVASLTLAGPADRWPEEDSGKYIRAVMDAAREISRKLSYISNTIQI